ncbi:hypothetical protein BK133_21195, partial [Paenibacillus sp. FSL H8-0548]
CNFQILHIMHIFQNNWYAIMFIKLLDSSIERFIFNSSFYLLFLLKSNYIYYSHYFDFVFRR